MSGATHIRQLLESLNLFEQQFKSDFISKVKQTDNWRKGYYWQAVLDVTYTDWKDESLGLNSYSDMIHHTIKHYGEFPALVVLLGKYNQQVTNGGHYQYLDNGYAGQSRPPGGRNMGGIDAEDIEIHLLMIELMGKYGLRNLPLGKEVYEVAQDFRVSCQNYLDDKEEWLRQSEDWEGEQTQKAWHASRGYHSDEDEEAYRDEEEEFSEPDPEDDIMQYFKYNDSKYYKINDEWERTFNPYIKRTIDKVSGATKMPVNRSMDLTGERIK